MEINTIYEGDNLTILKEFPDKSVDLIYADPPFFSNKHYLVESEDDIGNRAFADKWHGGINSYIEWIKGRLIECKRVLKDCSLVYGCGVR